MTQRFNHKERRFLVPIGSESDKKLQSLTGGRVYSVVTEYLDTPERTWSALSMGDERPKIRFRTYDGKESFLEKKIHSLNHTAKERIPMETRPSGLIRVGMTAYTRTEYTLEGTRVTVDRDLLCDAGSIAALVVEVKGRMPKVLGFLRKHEEPKFSKWKLLAKRLPSHLSNLLYATTERGSVAAAQHGTVRTTEV